MVFVVWPKSNFYISFKKSLFAKSYSILNKFILSFFNNDYLKKYILNIHYTKYVQQLIINYILTGQLVVIRNYYIVFYFFRLYVL